MDNFMCSVGFALCVWAGTWALVAIYYLLYGFGFTAFAAVFSPKPAEPSFISPSSIPAMVSSETVFEYVSGLKEPVKQEACLRILDSIKRLLLEMKKRPEAYPPNRGTFALGQLKSQISRSVIAGCAEAAALRKLGAEFIIRELEGS